MTQGGDGQGARLSGRAGDLTCIIFCGQVGCVVGGAQKEVEAPELPGQHYLGSLSCPSWLQAFSPAPAALPQMPSERQASVRMRMRDSEGAGSNDDLNVCGLPSPVALGFPSYWNH